MSVYFFLHRCCLSASATLLFHVSELESPGRSRYAGLPLDIERLRTLGASCTIGSGGQHCPTPSLGLTRRLYRTEIMTPAEQRFVIAVVEWLTEVVQAFIMAGRRFCLLLPLVFHGPHAKLSWRSQGRYIMAFLRRSLDENSRRIDADALMELIRKILGHTSSNSTLRLQVRPWE